MPQVCLRISGECSRLRVTGSRPLEHWSIFADKRRIRGNKKKKLTKQKAKIGFWKSVQ